MRGAFPLPFVQRLREVVLREGLLAGGSGDDGSGTEGVTEEALTALALDKRGPLQRAYQAHAQRLQAVEN